MPSPRRPGYLPAGRKAPSTGSGSASADVITASKDGAGIGNAAGKPPSQGNVVSFPEPRAKRRRRLVVGTLAALAVLIAGLLAAAVYSPVLALTTVSVEGTKMLTPDQIKTALAPLQGKPLPQISDDDVTALLRPLVQVKEVTTEARPPSTIQVKVTERVPVALVKQGQTYQMVDVDGVKLSDTADPASTRLPVIDGGNGTLPKDLFRATTEVLGALPAEVLSRLASASASSGDAVELKLVDGQTIVWGNAGEKELKARVLQALLKAPADPKNPVRIYDVSVPRHPVTR